MNGHQKDAIHAARQMTQALNGLSARLAAAEAKGRECDACRRRSRRLAGAVIITAVAAVAAVVIAVIAVIALTGGS